MAVGFPTKANWAAGDVLTASAQDDLAGTVNLLSNASASTGQYLVSNTAGTSFVYNNNFAAGKNAIINGAFNVWQRGTGTFTKTTGAEVYTADRWVISNDAGTITCAQQTFTPGTAPVAGYEGQFFARITTTASSSNALYLIQKIEDVRAFAGQTVTLSYWAKVSSGTVTNSPLAIQAFGSGGSGDVVTSLSSSTITTAWTRFTHTVAIPSISGKTVGTSSSLQMQVLRVGVSATIDIWGVQVEAGSVATAFQTASGSLGGELALCQRYYWRSTATSDSYVGTGLAGSATAAYIAVQNPVTMRVAPTVIDYSSLSLQIITTAVAVTSAGISVSTTSNVLVQANVTAGLVATTQMYMLRATSAGSGYLGFGAEL